jgi:hypothetical protein
MAARERALAEHTSARRVEEFLDALGRAQKARPGS